MGKLTTHVLDTARGKPAAGVKIWLYRVTGNSHRKIAEVVTNDDGRVDGPILEGAAFTEGGYELVFHAGDYLRVVDGEGANWLATLTDWPLAGGVPAAEFRLLADKRTTLEFVVDHLAKHAPQPVDAVELPVGAPFGSVAVSDACTLCMACPAPAPPAP